jgi:hypothetical protein
MATHLFQSNDSPFNYEENSIYEEKEEEKEELEEELKKKSSY